MRLQLIGQIDATKRAPTVSFRSKRYDPLSLTKALANEKIMVGSGHFYSYRLLESLGLNPDEGVCRASLVHYNTNEEMSRLINALEKLHKL